CDVARAQPTVFGEFLALHRHVVVAAGDEGPAHLDLADALAVVRLLAAVAPDAQVHQRHLHAGHPGAAVLLVVARAAKFRPRIRDRAYRRRLGHAPALHDPDPVLVERADQRLGHGRAADE